MLILILIDVRYLQKAVFSFEKGMNFQNHSSSGSLHPIKKFSPVKFQILPPPPHHWGEIYPSPTPYCFLENPAIETKPKQNQFSQICWKHIHMQPILFKWVGSLGLFLEEYHIENLNLKNVQSLITVGENRSFGNIFWLYNYRVFDAIKFVTFLKSWGDILELYAKAKSSLIPQKVQFFNKNLKKLSLCHYVPGVSDIHLIDQRRIKVWVRVESPSFFESETPRFGI